MVEAEAFVGGGSAPERPVRGTAVSLPYRSGMRSLLGDGDPPVVGYVREQRLVLDLRTVDPADDRHLIVAVKRAYRDRPAAG